MKRREFLKAVFSMPLIAGSFANDSDNKVSNIETHKVSRPLSSAGELELSTLVKVRKTCFQEDTSQVWIECIATGGFDEGGDIELEFWDENHDNLRKILSDFKDGSIWYVKGEYGFFYDADSELHFCMHEPRYCEVPTDSASSGIEIFKR